jgi:hypothetical protein
MYVLSFFIPIVGIVAGIIYMSRGDPESSALGKACLIISIAAIVIWCCVGVAFGVGMPFLAALLESY